MDGSATPEIDSPFLGNPGRRGKARTAFDRPLEDLGILNGPGAEIIRFGPDFYPVKVQTIGIPAGLDGNVSVGSAIGVILAGGQEQPKFRIGKMEMAFPEIAGQRSGPAAMAIIAALIDPPGIVENGKQFCHLDHGPGSDREPAAVFPNPGPMGNPMGSVQGQTIFSEDFIDKLWGDHSLLWHYNEISGEGEAKLSSERRVFGNSDVSPFILMKPEA